MYADASKELADAVHNSVTLLRTHLESDFNTYVDKIEKDFAKMLDTARATPRPETGPAKVALQREVLMKLSHFDGLLGVFKPRNGERVALDGLMDLTTMKDEDEDEDVDDDSEDGLDDLDELEDLDSDISNLNDLDSDAEGLSVGEDAD
jgi:hypothetical protein